MLWKNIIFQFDQTLFQTEALKTVIEAAKPGVSVLSLCEQGDAFITAETGKVFKKEKEIKKGEHVSINPKKSSNLQY